MKTYAERKEEIRNEAIEYQMSWQDHCYSYEGIIIMAEYFERMGRRYGLLREFRENAIC